MSEKHKSCLTIEDIRQKIAEINPGAVVLTEKYINNSQQLDIVCSDCGRVFKKLGQLFSKNELVSVVLVREKMVGKIVVEKLSIKKNLKKNFYNTV